MFTGPERAKSQKSDWFQWRQIQKVCFRTVSIAKRTNLDIKCKKPKKPKQPKKSKDLLKKRKGSENQATYKGRKGNYNYTESCNTIKVTVQCLLINNS